MFPSALLQWTGWLLLGGAGAWATPAPSALSDRLGVVHVDGQYHFTEQPFLLEGAEQILRLGARVVKVWFFRPEEKYRWNSTWPRYRSLEELAQTPYFRALFRMPFRTYVLVVYSLGRPEHYFRDGVTPDQAADESEQFYRLARYLLSEHAGTGKTFVLQHWEGDWAIRGKFDPDEPITDRAAQGMIAWLNARQQGVDRARTEVSAPDVAVYHAAEVNLVRQFLEAGKSGVVDRVLPYASVDLVSYSAWNALSDPSLLRRALDTIAAHAPDRPPFGNRNVYLGEFGSPENEVDPARYRRTIQQTIAVAADWECPYILFWQLYCNESRRPVVQVNEDLRGFWLIRLDGTRSWAWTYLQELLRPAAKNNSTR